MHLGSLKSTQETRVPQGALLRFFFALQTSQPCAPALDAHAEA